MKILENILYGFISGISEFLPISAPAHQKILCTVFGTDASDPVRNLFVHIAILVALYICTKNARNRISKARYANASRKKGNVRNSKLAREYSVLRSIAVPFLILFFLLSYIIPRKNNLFTVFLMLILNGIVIFIPERMLRGNKNAKVVSRLDCALIGFAGGFSILPGISRIGAMLSVASMRGVEKKVAANWTLLLSIPALFAMIILDILSIFSVSDVVFWGNLIYYIVSGITAFLGTRIAVYFFRKYIRVNGCTGYSYYCWGAAFFCLILFLTIA